MVVEDGVDLDEFERAEVAVGDPLHGGVGFAVRDAAADRGPDAGRLLGVEPVQVQGDVNAVGSVVRDLEGEIAFAVRLEEQRGALGFGVPRSLLFAKPAEIKAIVEMLNTIDEARQKAWAAQVPAQQP